MKTAYSLTVRCVYIGLSYANMIYFVCFLMSRMWRKKFSLCAQVGWCDKCCSSYSSFSIWIRWTEMLGMFSSVHCGVTVARFQTAATEGFEGSESWFTARQRVVFVSYNWQEGLTSLSVLYTNMHCRYRLDADACCHVTVDVFQTNEDEMRCWLVLPFHDKKNKWKYIYYGWKTCQDEKFNFL